MARAAAIVALAAALLSCGGATDPATRLAADIEDGAARLGSENGATTSVVHAVPSQPGECDGPYKLQLDRVGAMIVWCEDGSGETVSSHSTSSHSRSVDTAETFLVDKGAGEGLMIGLERRGGRAVITDVQ
jgi:hypothetical protein